MGIVRRSRRTHFDSLADRPLAPHVDAFKLHLTKRRYVATTFARYLAGITHFAQWARTRRLRLSRIDEGSIAEFLDDQPLLHRSPLRHDQAGGHGHRPRPASGARSAACGRFCEIASVRERSAVATSCRNYEFSAAADNAHSASRAG